MVAAGALASPGQAQHCHSSLDPGPQAAGNTEPASAVRVRGAQGEGAVGGGGRRRLPGEGAGRRRPGGRPAAAHAAAGACRRFGPVRPRVPPTGAAPLGTWRSAHLPDHAQPAAQVCWDATGCAGHREDRAVTGGQRSMRGRSVGVFACPGPRLLSWRVPAMTKCTAWLRRGFSRDGEP